MDAERLIPARRFVAATVVAALLGACATALVMTHPFTDEGSGIRLLGADGHGRPDGPGDHTPPGWSHGDKPGWKGADVPPGWSRGDKPGWKGADVPPGWSRGDKPGWKGADVPPGWSRGDKPGWKGADVPPGWMHAPQAHRERPGATDEKSGPEDDSGEHDR